MKEEKSSTPSLPHLSDEDLVESIRGGDSNAATYLVEKYARFVESIARKYFIQGADYEDVMQEGYIGFYEAVLNYKKGYRLNFQSFAYYCIQKNIFDAIQAASRKKRKAQAEAISLDEEIPEQDKESRLRIIDQIIHQGNINPEDMVIMKIMVKELVTVLSPLEKQVLKAHLEGKSYEEMSKEIKKEPKAIGNALQRARAKIKEYFMDEIKEPVKEEVKM